MKGFAIYPTGLGLMRISYRDGVVELIKKVPEKPLDMGVRTALTDKVFGQLQEYFDGSRKVFDFPRALHGTPFQQRVWAALAAIPYGETRSYQDIARAIGNAKAARAVGMANHKNPLIIVVPCHRVIGADGRLAGYGGGVAMKAALLALEKNVSASADKNQ